MNKIYVEKNSFCTKIYIGTDGNGKPKYKKLKAQTEKELEKKGMRVTVDDRSEKTGYKIRESRLQKLPYWIIVGDKEVEDGTVSVSKRGQGDIGSMSFDDFAAMLKKEIDEKVR